MRLLFSLTALLMVHFALAQNLPVVLTYTYATGQFDDGGTEINAYDKVSRKLFSTNAAEQKIDIIDVKDINKPGRVGRIDLSSYGGSVNSVAVFSNTVVVAMENNLPQAAGKLLFFDTAGVYVNQVQVGALPDMVTFTPNGLYILVANEGEPSDDYTLDPPGSVSIINFNGANAAALSQSDVSTVEFTRYDTLPYDPNIRVFGNNGQQSFSQDIEPEYITFNAAGTKAYVACQENNALAIIDVFTASLDTVVGLGFKDHSLAGNGFDASDRANAIDIKVHPNVFGMYQPDAIKGFNVNGVDYIISANEGDVRDYSGYSEEERVKDLSINPIIFNNPSIVQNDTNLGRLTITNSLGNARNGFVYDSLFVFGARSFSIWDENGQQVYDSGDEFEQTLAQLHPSEFNSDNDDNSSYKSRSGAKGPEPEAVAVGEVDGVMYAFVGLERMGGFMVYDLSNPLAPVFDQYVLNRDFSVSASDPNAGDLGPEDITFISAADSPNGIAMIAVSNEVSGTLSLYQLGQGIGLKERNLNEGLNLVPNPAQNWLKLAYEQDLEIYNNNGSLIKEVKGQLRVDISDLPEGYYLVRTNEGQVIKILKKY